MKYTDVCIIGAGPAGATLSHFLTKKKIDHVIIDKAKFPRDKICGDGITVDVMNTLKRLDPQMLDEFIHESEMLPSWGFCFRSANGKELRYDFRKSGFPYAPIFTSRRLDLDNFLVSRFHTGHSHFMDDTRVADLIREQDSIRVCYKSGEREGSFNTRLVIGAEGEKPVVTRYLGLEHFREKEHLIGAIRVYYRNVKGFDSGNHLEFFFDRKLLPGYFWAFPLSNNEANVGLGMVSTAISARKFNLKKVFFEMLETHPVIREMFAGAEPLEDPRGWGLPIITPKRAVAGDRYALIGDAAGMIEPFTGKGIGPGMVSARICAEHIEQALQKKDFNMAAYQKHMYRYYSKEIQIGYTLQKTLKYPPVLNAVVGLFTLSAVKQWSQNKRVTAWKEWM